MADLVALIKIFPESDTIDLDELLNILTGKLPKDNKIVKWEKEPIAFGLENLKIRLVMPENTKGGTDPIENIINAIPGVDHVEVVGVARM